MSPSTNRILAWVVQRRPTNRFTGRDAPVSSIVMREEERPFEAIAEVTLAQSGGRLPGASAPDTFNFIITFGNESFSSAVVPGGLGTWRQGRQLRCAYGSSIRRPRDRTSNQALSSHSLSSIGLEPVVFFHAQRITNRSTGRLTRLSRGLQAQPARQPLAPVSSIVMRRSSLVTAITALLLSTGFAPARANEPAVEASTNFDLEAVPQFLKGRQLAVRRLWHQGCRRGRRPHCRNGFRIDAGMDVPGHVSWGADANASRSIYG